MNEEAKQMESLHFFLYFSFLLLYFSLSHSSYCLLFTPTTSLSSFVEFTEQFSSFPFSIILHLKTDFIISLPTKTFNLLCHMFDYIVQPFFVLLYVLHPFQQSSQSVSFIFFTFHITFVNLVSLSPSFPGVFAFH